MTMLRSMGRGIAWTTAGTGSSKILVLANVLIILSYLSIYEYGLTELVFSVVSMLSILLLPGLYSTVVADMGVERARGELGRMKSIFLQYVVLSVALGTLAFTILFLAAPIAAQLSGNSSIEYFLRIVSFSFLVSPLRSLTQLMAVVHVRFIDQAAYPLVEEMAKTACLLVTFYVLAMGPAGLLYTYVLAPLMAAIVFLPRTVSGYLHFSRGTAANYLHFWRLLGTHRKWSVATSYMGTLGQNAQLWIIRLMLGTEAVGLYAFATGIVGNVSSFLPLSSVLASLAPRYAKRKEELARLLRVSVKAQFGLAIALSVAAICALPLFLIILPKYASALPLAAALLANLIPGSLLGLFAPVYATLKLQREYFFSMLIKATLIVALIPLGIAVLGLYGTALAVTCVTLLSGLERYLRLTRVFPEFSMSLRSLFSLSPREQWIMREAPRWLLSRRSLAALLEKDRV